MSAQIFRIFPNWLFRAGTFPNYSPIDAVCHGSLRLALIPPSSILMRNARVQIWKSAAVLTCPTPKSSPELSHLWIPFSPNSSSSPNSSCSPGRSSPHPLLPCLQPLLLLLPHVGPKTVTIAWKAGQYLKGSFLICVIFLLARGRRHNLIEQNATRLRRSVSTWRELISQV